MWDILWVSCLSGLSTPFGALLVVMYHETVVRIQGFFWGIAAGIMTTLVIVELMPSAINIGGNRLFFIVAGTGCIIMLLVRHMLSRTTKGAHPPEQANLLQMGWFVAIAIALHDLPEGMAIAAGGAVRPEMGLVIAVAIALHNIPEGMSIAFPLSLAGVDRARILRLTLWIGLITPLGTLASLWIVHVSSAVIASALALASGTMLLVVSQDILPEALRQGKLSALLGGLLGGLLMSLLTLLHV